MPPNDITAIPERAAPLVQPRPSCEPIPQSIPPINAPATRILVVVLGPFSSLKSSLFEINPDKNAPIKTPVTSKTSQFKSGLVPGCSSAYSL